MSKSMIVNFREFWVEKGEFPQQSHSEQFSCVYFDFFKQIRPKYWRWEQNVECYKPRWWLLNAGVVNCAEQEPRLTFPTVTEWPKTRAATSPSGSARVYIVTDRTSWRPTWGNSGTRRLETRSPPKLRRVGPKLEICEKENSIETEKFKKPSQGSIDTEKFCFRPSWRHKCERLNGEAWKTTKKVSETWKKKLTSVSQPQKSHCMLLLSGSWCQNKAKLDRRKFDFFAHAHVRNCG